MSIIRALYVTSGHTVTPCVYMQIVMNEPTQYNTENQSVCLL